MEPFEVMISESQERMFATVLPAKLDAVLAVCRRWNLPAAVIGRVTDDGDITIVTGGLDADGHPEPGARSSPACPPAALTSDAIVHQRVGARRPRTAATRPRPGAPEPSRAACRSAAWTPARCSRRCSATPTSRSPRLGHPPVRRDRGHGHRGGLRACRRRAARQGHHARRSSWPPTPNARVGLIDPWLGAAMAVAECARNIAVTGARAAGRHQLPQLRLARAPGGVLAAPGGRPRPGRRLPGAGPRGHRRQRQPVQRIGRHGRHRAHLPDRHRGPARGHRPLVRPAFRGRRRRWSCCSAGPCPGMAGSIYAELAGTAPDDRPPALDLAAEAALGRLLPAAAAAGLLRSAQDVSGGGLAVALAECACGASVGADLAVGVGAEPAVRAVRRGPRPGRRDRRARGLRSALAALAAEHGVPLRRLGETGGDRLRIRLAGEGPRAPPRSAAPASRTPSMSRSPRCATPGSAACRGPSARMAATPARRLGRIAEPMCGVVGVHAPGQEAAPHRRAGAVRAPAPRPGVGRASPSATARA